MAAPRAGWTAPSLAGQRVARTAVSWAERMEAKMAGLKAGKMAVSLAEKRAV